MRRNQTNSALFNRHTIAAIGDSQTDLTAFYGVAPEAMWTSKLSQKLNRLGALTRARVFGASGDTTAQMLGRADILFQYDTPKIGVVYGGVNDPYSTATGTAQAGTSTTITLASGATGLAGSYIGQVITTTGGTGSGQTKTIIGYVGSTKVATVDSAWSVTPNATTTYSIAIPTQAQTQANIQALVKVLKFKAVGAGAGLGCMVWNQASLPANGAVGQRYVVMQDNSTTGGAQRTSTIQNANIPGDYSAAIVQTVWEYRNPQAGELGWARVALASTPSFSDGVAKVIVLTNNYLNWAASAGDNYNTRTGTGTQFAAYIPIRSAATAASSAESVTLCDQYDFESKLIFGGTFNGLVLASETVQGSNTYHYTAGNQHFSSYGHDCVARAMAQTIVNANWLTDLQS